MVTLDPALEDRIGAGIDHDVRGPLIRMSAQEVDNTCSAIAAALDKLTAAGHPPVVLCSPQIRPGLRQLTAANLPDLAVLSYDEIIRESRIESVGMVRDISVAQAREAQLQGV